MAGAFRTYRPRVREWVDAVHRTLGMGEQILGSLLLAVILGLVVLQAAQRHLPVDGWTWTGEVARYSLVWLTFAVAGYLTTTEEHVGIHVVDLVVHKRVLDVIKRAANAVVAVAAIAFFVDTWALVVTDTAETSPSAKLPIQLLYLMPLIGLGITTLRAGWAVLAGPPRKTATDAEGNSEA